MKYSDFASIFSDLDIPVVICENGPDYPVIYMNMQASLLFSPSHSADNRSGNAARVALRDILHFGSAEGYDNFLRMVAGAQRVAAQPCQAVTFEGREVPVIVSGNAIRQDGEEDCYVFYLLDSDNISNKEEDYFTSISSIITASFLASNVDESIQTVLSMSGQFMNVSRTYIFEEISPTTTRNTYEWCADGVAPAIQDLQSLDKADYPYDDIISTGMFITDDVSTLPEADRSVLEMQGIKSLAIIPIYEFGGALGYVGYDDTGKRRVWTYNEIQFLKNISALLANLIKRRNSERSVRTSQNVLQLVANNLDDVIYVNRLDDYRLLFVSRSLAEGLGKTEEELLGQVCWQTFQFGKTGPCSFCPIPKIKLEPGQDRSEVYVWENYNPRMDKTYLAKDSIIRWVDGSMVHLETGTDISQRREYEDKLRYYASTDVMTGVYNREWGGRILEQLLANPGTDGSLVFIDVDGLKATNDTLGHSAGDELLTEIIRVTRAGVGETTFICRWGGDEFLLYLKAPGNEARAIIEGVQSNLALAEVEGAFPFKLSFSYGIVPFRHNRDASLDALVSDADKLMYENKMEKRGLHRRKTDPLT